MAWKNSRRPGRLALATLFVAALSPAGAAAELLPEPYQIALPAEKSLLSSTLTAIFENVSSDAGKHLPVLDATLKRLDQPTPLRGYIQFLRASLLSGQDKDVAAREAIDESVRLLPGYSGPLLLASHIYAYADQPGPAADYLVRASRIDPDPVRQMDEYEVNNIIRRLNHRQDQPRIRLLSERLLEIGWLGDSLDSRSTLARRAIEARIEEGDPAGAKALVSKIVNPADAQSLLIQNRYDALWTDIERWSGDKLHKLWDIYLPEARAKWQGSRDPDSTLAYVRALDRAGHHQTIIREMLPLFSREMDRRKDYDLVFVASPLAEALARSGRWDDIDRMYQAALKTWPMGEHANALNLAANRARYLHYRGNHGSALMAMDAALADAKRWKGQVNGDALASMHYYRVCMLHELGRDDEAARSRAFVVAGRSAVAVAQLNLCLGKHELARDVLIAVVQDEGARQDVIEFVQKSSVPPMQSDYGRKIAARSEALRSDPLLLSEIAKYGRVLPFALSEGAPVELSAAKAL